MDSSLDTAIQEAASLIEEVKQLDTFDNETTIKALKHLYDAYFTFASVQFRKNMADKLAEIGFAELSVKMKKWSNKEGPFKDQIIWNVTNLFLSNVWNYSDSSLLLCQRLIEANFVRFLLGDLKHPAFLENLGTTPLVSALLLAEISILHNVSKVHEMRETFYDLNTISVLQLHLEGSNNQLKHIATMAIAHIIKEKDNDKIMASADVLNQLAVLLRSALKSQDHRFDGFTAEELTDALGLLAVNDANKKKILDANTLPSFKKMIAGKDADEQLVALKAISNLTFDSDVRATIQKDSELLLQLQNLTKSSQENIKRLAASALWVINEKSEEKTKEAEKKEEENTTVKKGHVMISYNWANQAILLRVRDALQVAGFTVWMDVNDISGSTLQAMAEAIEGANVVLMCMSEKYKNSANCRIEAEYAFKRQKPILPLMMQRGYDPDGWLGIILGSKLFVEFSDKYPFEKSSTNLIQQINHMLAEISGEKPTNQASSKIVSTSVHSSQQFVKWSREDVAGWLKTSGFERYNDKFSQVDGSCLYQLQEIRKSLPKFFFKSMQKEMCFQFTDILRFCSEMDKLP